MARTAEAWKLVLLPGRSYYSVRFTWGGRRYFRGTGRNDPSEAAIEAAKIYADTVSGRIATEVEVSTNLTDAAAEFLAHYTTQHEAGTSETAEMYFAAHIIPFFGSFERFTAASYDDYVAKRFLRVTRRTVQKELSLLRQFRVWLCARGIETPPIPKLAKDGQQGTRAKNARKSKATVLSEKEAQHILAAMPERSRRTKCWVRPLFTVLWETGLRPTTVLRLEAGKHFTKGAKRLFITADIDKEHFERWVPLTEPAIKALTKVFPPSGAGRLFDADPSSLRHSLDAALRKTGIKKAVSPYDLKHSMITNMVNGASPLAGVAHLVGHRHVSTTALYVQTGERAAEEALRVSRVSRNGASRRRGTTRTS